MEKITVEICCGTACYILGASSLVDLEQELDEGLRGMVEIEAKSCLELCEKEMIGSAPFVRINGSEIIESATKEKVLKRIGELARGTEENA